MSEFFGDLLVKAVPFILPVLLVLSLLVNTKGPLPSGKGGSDDGAEKPKKAPQPKKEAPAPKKAPEPKKPEESLDAPISDEDMT